MEELECYKFIRGLLHSPERLADDLRKCGIWIPFDFRH